jgi:holo-[acyl-carrier protein] synthase
MPKIMGIGVDAENIDRFRKIEKTSPILKNTFTKNELAGCFGKKDYAQRLASRFCAKEAIIKAFGGLDKKIFYNQIEITNSENGAPKATIMKSSLARRFDILISYSHNRLQAVSFAVIIEKNGKNKKFNK